MRQHLSAAQVAELAELLEEAPVRIGVIDAVLEAASQGRGMTLVLADLSAEARGPHRRRPRARDPVTIVSTIPGQPLGHSGQPGQ